MNEKGRGYLIARTLASILVTELVDDITVACRLVEAKMAPTASEITAIREMVKEAQRKRAAYDLEVYGFERMMALYLKVCGDENGPVC